MSLSVIVTGIQYRQIQLWACTPRGEASSVILVAAGRRHRNVSVSATRHQNVNLVVHPIYTIFSSVINFHFHVILQHSHIYILYIASLQKKLCCAHHNNQFNNNVYLY